MWAVYPFHRGLACDMDAERGHPLALWHAWHLLVPTRSITLQ